MGLTFEKYKIHIFIWLITKVLKINIPSFKLLSDNSDIDTLIQFKITSIDDSLIIILDKEIKIENNGEFGKDLNSDCIQYPIPDYRVFCGEIEDDSIKFSVYQGGLGCFSDYQCYGKKINN